MESAPIIFVHSGDSDYLRYTLDAARLFNRDKKVYLLGDASNKFFEVFGITHVEFKNYEQSPEIELFEKVYRHVAGETHGRHEWLKFGFKRFYYLNNFVKKMGFKEFWNMDSDTLIFAALTPQEDKFREYDCTSQCNGSCLSGFIHNPLALQAYVDKTNAVFQETDFITKTQENFKDSPQNAFTDMATFERFRDESGFRIMQLNTIINGETFDDCICQQHDMEMASDKLKKLYFDNVGNTYTKHLPSDSFIRLNTVNMSWVSTHLIAELFFRSIRKLSCNIG